VDRSIPPRSVPSARNLFFGPHAPCDEAYYTG
jgi:hypothetical protein